VVNASCSREPSQMSSASVTRSCGQEVGSKRLLQVGGRVRLAYLYDAEDFEEPCPSLRGLELDRRSP
jgi:hypothetical protein